MKTRIIVSLLFVSILFWAVLALFPAAVNAAPSNCPDVYVVKRGEWLALIARRTGTSVNELLRLNPILYYRMNLIYPGEKLCIPAQNPGPLQEVSSWLSLEAVYTLNYTPTVRLQAPMNTIGRHQQVPLQTIDARNMVTDTDYISLTLMSFAPNLVALRNVNSDGALRTDFTMYEVGSGDVLSGLAADAHMPHPIAQSADCAAHPLAEVYGAGSKSLTAWLESGNGVRFPFAISQVAVIPQGQFSRCFAGKDANLVAFAVMPAQANSSPPYALLLHLLPPTSPNDYYIYGFFCYYIGFC